MLTDEEIQIIHNATTGDAGRQAMPGTDDLYFLSDYEAACSRAIYNRALEDAALRNLDAADVCADEKQEEAMVQAAKNCRDLKHKED